MPVAVALVVLIAGAGDAGARPLVLRLTPFEVAPGSDRIPCEYVELPNDTAIDVTRFVVKTPRTRLHHILLYAYLGDDRDPRHLTRGLRDGDACSAIGPPDRAGRMVGLLGAVRSGAYDLPPGYAVPIRARQPVSVQMHAFNHSSRTRRAVARVKLVPADPRSVRHRLEPMDVVNEHVELPPRARSAATSDFVAPFAMQVAMVSSHQHRLGTRVTVWPVRGGVEEAAVYENRRWSEPPLRWLDPPIALAAGDRLRVRCEWNNRTDETVRYGPSATDEMCNLNGYFFRDAGVPAERRTGIVGTLVPVAE